MTRGRVCRLQFLLVLASAVIFGSESHGTRGHILLSQIRDFPFRRFHDSQGYGGGIRPRLHTGFVLYSLHNFGKDRIEVTTSNISSIIVFIRCCGNVFSETLPSNGCLSVVESVTSGMCLPSRFLAMVICVTIYTQSFI
jgi:hypothetical protein